MIKARIKNDNHEPYLFKGNTYEVLDKYKGGGFFEDDDDKEFVSVMCELNFPIELFADSVELVEE